MRNSYFQQSELQCNSNNFKKCYRGICSNVKDDPVKLELRRYFRPFAKAYTNIFEQQIKSFFGLRDFYRFVCYIIIWFIWFSLIKMLYWMCKNSGRPLTSYQLEHAIKRNFSGLEEIDTYEMFKNEVKNLEKESDLSNIPQEVNTIIICNEH